MPRLWKHFIVKISLPWCEVRGHHERVEASSRGGLSGCQLLIAVNKFHFNTLARILKKKEIFQISKDWHNIHMRSLSPPGWTKVRKLRAWPQLRRRFFRKHLLKEERILNHNLSYSNWWSWFEGTQSAPQPANKAVESCFSALTNQALPYSQCQQSQYGAHSRLK